MWSLMNRFRTGQGPCRANLHKRGLAWSPSCDCGQRQTMNHIVDTCPLTKFEGGLNLLRTMMQSYGWNLQRLQHSRNYNSTPVCRTLGRRPEALVLLNSAKAYTGEHLNTHSEDIVAYCEHLERFTFVLLMLQRAIGGRWSQCQRAGRYAVQWGKHCIIIIIIIIINEYCYSAWSQKKTSRALNTHTHTHGPFFRDYPGVLVPER